MNQSVTKNYEVKTDFYRKKLIKAVPANQTVGLNSVLHKPSSWAGHTKRSNTGHKKNTLKSTTILFFFKWGRTMCVEEVREKKNKERKSALTMAR